MNKFKRIFCRVFILSNMKKLLTALFLIIVLIIAGLYIFIPAKAEIGKNHYLESNTGSAMRILADTSSWSKWWPEVTGRKVPTSAPFYFDDFGFQFSHDYPGGVSVSILNDTTITESTITLVQVNKDSVMLIWKCGLQESNWPIVRLQNYYRANKIRNSMTGIIKSLNNFLQKDENIYGIPFDITMSQDSTLVMTKGSTEAYPSEKYIYGLIGELKNYIRDEGALETNHPMLDVKKISDHHFETMVAIPANRELPGKGSIYFSRFVPWKVLTAEVKGGVKTVEEALHRMDLYINDHQLTRMAISFQSLVTNRMEQPDSTQWITRIYTPVP